jgi:hypothetical protein
MDLGMEPPRGIDFPFFAYGLFRPGQLAFFQLRELVSRVNDPAEVSGTLLIRDGLPIIDPEGRERVRGALLTFVPERAAQDEHISAMEPDKHYLWHVSQVEGTSANFLVGRCPRKGSVPCEDAEWNGWNDPLFTEALDVVEETLNSQVFDWDLKPLFKLQMAYLLLWSSIERYVSLRYHLGDRVTDKVGRLAREPAFAECLRRHVKNRRVVYRADRPGDKEVLEPGQPGKAVQYYYQVRSNITHRGKAVIRDYDLLKASLAELLPIFREVLKGAERDSQYPHEDENFRLL